MAPCTYEQVERFITKEKKLFAAVKKQLRDKYQCNFRGVVPNDAHPYDRYVTAFNKHPQAFNEAIGMSMEKAFSLTHSKNKDKVSKDYKNMLSSEQASCLSHG